MKRKNRTRSLFIRELAQIPGGTNQVPVKPDNSTFKLGEEDQTTLAIGEECPGTTTIGGEEGCVYFTTNGKSFSENGRY